MAVTDIRNRNKMSLVDKVVYKIARFRTLGESLSIILDQKDRAKLSYKVRTMNEEAKAFYYYMKTTDRVTTVTLLYLHGKGWHDGRRPITLQGGPRV